MRDIAYWTYTRAAQFGLNHPLRAKKNRIIAYRPNGHRNDSENCPTVSYSSTELVAGVTCMPFYTRHNHHFHLFLYTGTSRFPPIDNISYRYDVCLEVRGEINRTVLCRIIVY